MSVYFTHRVHSPLIDCKYVNLSWHPYYALLAVVGVKKNDNNNSTVGGGIVFFCHDEGEVITDLCIERSSQVGTITWHPDRKILAIGWTSGEIIICNVHDTETYILSSPYQSPVCVLQWSTNGSHILGGYKSGIVTLWQVDPKGQINDTPLYQCKVSGPVTHSVVLPQDNKAANTRNKTSPLIAVLATLSGQLYLFNGIGKCVEVDNLKVHLTHLIYSQETSFLAALTDNMLLVIFSTQNNSLQKYSEAKISSEGSVSCMVWTSPGVLATCSQEPSVRFWNTIENENYTLSLKDYCTVDDKETVTSISYDNLTGLLSAGTSLGHSLIWTKNEDTNKWLLITYITAQEPVDILAWGSGKHLLATCHQNGVHVLKEHHVSACYNQQISAVQLTENSVILQSHIADAVINLSTDIIISGLTVSKEHIAVWNGTTVYVYAISFAKENYDQCGTFASSATLAVIYENSIYTIEGGQLCVRSVVGVLKHKVPLGVGSDEGVVSLRLSSHYLVISIVDGSVKMFDLNRREPKLICSSAVSQHVPDFLNISSAQSNSNGSLIAFIATKTSNKSLLVLLNHEKETFKCLEFSKKDSVLSLPDNLPENIEKDQYKMATSLLGTNMVRFYWDGTDPRLLVTEVHHMGDYKTRQTWESAIVTLFITSDLTYLIQDINPLKSKYHSLIGCTAPSLYYMRKNLTTPLSVDSTLGTKVPLPVDRSPLRDFLGLEDCDSATVKAILSFSYHSTMGSMDEAFKDVRNIKSKSVWETLAMMCVKTHRLDVALVCLGNMGNARAAMAVRKAKNVPEEEAQLAVLAVHLGMLDTAEELYQSSGRYDLLNQFYQSTGRWQKAIEVAEVNDRLHLKNTFYNLAKYSESVGEIKSAIKSYEQSDSHRFEVVRMLINDPDELLDYTVKSQDKDIQHYWAEHLECSGELDSAIDQYKTCGDIKSVVRLMIFSGDEEGAIKVVEETRDRSAAYHVAKVFAQSEDWQHIKKAVHFYTMAQCYSHAITVAQEFGMDQEVMNLALLSTNEDKVEAAKYFENKSEFKENAIILYHRAGELSKALELCFLYRQYDILQQIAEELTEGTNPETVRRVAEYFIQQEQFEKAVQILLQSQRMSDALEMCLTHHVIISEELADKLTPQKIDNETPEQSADRIRRLNELGDGLASQGSYHLAAIKYTQASNKIQAMKALLKSGDTERIVFFANVSRQRDIYIMAANYLQSLDWRSDPEIMKNIISFYTKGKALDVLSNFYDTCAKVEIEEYQNYDRAQGALNEAVSVLDKWKVKNPSNAVTEKLKFLQKRLELVEKFNEIRNTYTVDPDTSIRGCLSLLSDPSLDTALRTGDVYAMIITHCTYSGNYQQAYEYIQEMTRRLPGVNLSLYIKTQTLEDISKGLGESTIRPTAASTTDERGEDSDDSIEEAVD